MRLFLILSQVFLIVLILSIHNVMNFNYSVTAMFYRFLLIIAFAFYWSYYFVIRKGKIQ